MSCTELKPAETERISAAFWIFTRKPSTLTAKNLLRMVFSSKCYYENTDGCGIGNAFDDIFSAAPLSDWALNISVQALLIKNPFNAEYT